MTSFSAAVGGSIVNQIKYTYDGWGQLKSEQSHVGAVTAGTPGVTYTYEDGADADGDALYRRLRYMTYPSGRVVYSIYEDTPAGRLVAQSENAGGTQRIVEYDYLGMNTIVRESRPMVAGGLALSYGSGTTYAGFDRFGRVVSQEWRKTDGTLVDGYGYTYDRAGNRTSKTNLLNSAYSETYGYDGLNRLVSTARNGTALQGWELDSLGNWDRTTTSSGTQTREHNSANEITDVSEGGVPAHDAVGNMTSIPTVSSYVIRMRYDAWNRLVSVEHEVAPDAWVEYACYGYDGLGRLVTTGHFPGTIDYYYNENHQFIEIRDDMPGYEYTEVSQFVWSLRYIDAPVMGYIETDREAVTTLVRQYYTQDANFNITASVDGATGAVMGRAVYTPYGKRTQLGADWSGTGDVGRFGHQGLMEMRDSAGTGLYYNRARFYHPTLGRFAQRDPLGYVDGGSLYEYVRARPTNTTDWQGLLCQKPFGVVGTGIKVLAASSPMFGKVAACNSCATNAPRLNAPNAPRIWSGSSVVSYCHWTFGYFGAPWRVTVSWTPSCTYVNGAMHALVFTGNGFGYAACE